MQRIADKVGLTKGALYGHFATKEDLAAVFAERLSKVTATLSTVDSEPVGRPFQELRELLMTAATVFQEDDITHAAFRLAAEEASATDTQIPLMAGMRESVWHLVNRLQQEEQWASPVTTAHLTDLIVAAFFGTYWTSSAEDRNELIRRTDNLWEMLSGALMRGSAEC
ncbi:TetR family transcriptional regulator [Streptomyces sp. NPDC088725]|uniref:TetR family transcriptional regulator n=1 Tax=Streptomyces sp. NPDC088725 TaxID=3365873 RepID=UPI00381C3709